MIFDCLHIKGEKLWFKDKLIKGIVNVKDKLIKGSVNVKDKFIKGIANVKNKLIEGIVNVKDKLIKGILNLILSDLPCKADVNARFTTVLTKALSTQLWKSYKYIMKV